MKNLTAILLPIIMLTACTKAYIPREIETVQIEEFSMPNSSIRAITPHADTLLYYATSDGKIGAMDMNFNIQHEITMQEDTIVPHFRAIASNGSAVFALSIENPAFLYRYEEGKAALVYKEDHPGTFYDAMTFFDTTNGIAIGDATEGCLSVIVTHDAGESWKKISCDKLPAIADGEAAFAASNGNIATKGAKAWVVTGGKKSRVFMSHDYGETWTVTEAPTMEGDQMTGSYAVDFVDEHRGIMVGGDWNNKADSTASKALTQDGGATWQLITTGPGYRSSVQYVPGTEGKEVFSVSSTGISYSNDGGETWNQVSEKGFYSLRFVNKNFAWLSGNNKIAKMTLSN